MELSAHSTFNIHHSTFDIRLSKFAQRGPLIRRFAAPSPRKRGEGHSRWECRVPLAPRSGERVADGRVRGSCILLNSFAVIRGSNLDRSDLIHSLLITHHFE